jgi:predicted amidohydrolase YtcJ
VIAAGSDAPVEVGDPRIEFYAAVYRHSLDGFANADWHLEEAVSRDQALRMLTWGPAYAAFARRSAARWRPARRPTSRCFRRT